MGMKIVSLNNPELANQTILPFFSLSAKVKHKDPQTNFETTGTQKSITTGAR